MKFKFAAIFLVFIILPAFTNGSAPISFNLHFPKVKREFFGKLKLVEAILKVPFNKDIDGLWTLLKAKKPTIKAFLTGATLSGLQKTPVFQRKEHLLKVVGSVFSSLDFIKKAFAKLKTQPSKREIKTETNSCTFSLKIFDANLSTDLISFTHYLTKIEETITANTRNVAVAASFVTGNNFKMLNALIESSISIAENWQMECNDYIIALKLLISNRELQVSSFKKIFPANSDENCLKDISLLAKQNTQIEECNPDINSFKCNLLFLIAESPKTLYEMSPLIYNGCFVNKKFYTDGENNFYKTICNKDYPNFNCYIAIKTSTDPCLNAIKLQKSDSIKEHCELKISPLEFETGFHGLVVHKLTDQSKSMLKDLKVRIPEAPFQIMDGSLDLKVNDDHFNYAYVKGMVVNSPKLPFPKTDLCPTPPTLLETTYENFIQGLYPAFAVMAAQTVLAGLVYGAYRLIKYLVCLCKDKDKKKKRRFNQHLQEILLSEVEPSRKHRTRRRRQN